MFSQFHNHQKYSPFRKRHFWKLGTSAGLQKIGICQNELKFYVTVDRIVCSSYQTDLAWNYRAKYWSVQSFYFWKTGRFFFETQKMFERNALFVEKIWNMKWNDFDCSSMWCVSLIWSKCQELKMRDNMLPLN